MAHLKVVTSDTLISRYVGLNVKQEVLRTTQKLLDGSTYIQRIGEPMVSYELTIFVKRDGKRLLQDAEDTLLLLEASLNHGVYYGRIVELSFSERLAADWFKAVAILAKEET